LVVTVCLGVLAVAAILTLLRAVQPGMSLADRVVALDVFLTIIVTGIAVAAIRAGSAVFLDMIVVVSLLGFVATITVARFIERRGL
jgi:multicomponent Na+:H+ antiporter subunit F